MTEVINQTIAEPNLQQFPKRLRWPHRIRDRALRLEYLVGAERHVGLDPNPMLARKLCRLSSRALPFVDATISGRHLHRPQAHDALSANRREQSHDRVLAE